MVEFVAL